MAVSKIRGILFGSPCNQDHSMSGYILGPHVYRTLHEGYNPLGDVDVLGCIGVPFFWVRLIRGTTQNSRTALGSGFPRSFA